ncbi:MAG: phosphate signaling complex protein PhoU [Alphaproteobacteria bacterium]|nr:phosphate signaling complex protein PhoU [Alphaproteobacteria bacterium]
MPNAHIVKSYDDELRLLRDQIAQMGGLAEAQLKDAVDAVVRRDPELAERVVRADARIDALEHDVMQRTIRMLALRQPMAADLREVVSALRIAGDIERIGDYAKNIAKRVKILAQQMPVRSASAIKRMGDLVQEIIKQVLDAYVNLDTDSALEAWRRDEQVDALYNSLFRELLTYMMEDPRTITPCTHLLFIAKNIERIGDHATNVAEILFFQVRGTLLDEERPKVDSVELAAAGTTGGRA